MKDLDSTSMRILKYLKKNPKSTLTALTNDFGDDASLCIETLLDERLIYKASYLTVESKKVYWSNYSLTAKGKGFLQQRKKNLFLTWDPLIIGIATFIVSLLSLIVSLIILFQ